MNYQLREGKVWTQNNFKRRDLIVNKDNKHIQTIITLKWCLLDQWTKDIAIVHDRFWILIIASIYILIILIYIWSQLMRILSERKWFNLGLIQELIQFSIIWIYVLIYVLIYVNSSFQSSVNILWLFRLYINFDCILVPV